MSGYYDYLTRKPPVHHSFLALMQLSSDSPGVLTRAQHTCVQDPLSFLCLHEWQHILSPALFSLPS